MRKIVNHSGGRCHAEFISASPQAVGKARR